MVARHQLTLLLTCFLILYIQTLLAEVTVLKYVQTVYDKSPKIRIKGSGFDDIDEHDIILDLAADGEDSLINDKDYMITKDLEGEGLILKLLTNRKWVNLLNRTPPVGLILSSVKFASDPNKNLLHEPIIIAKVLPAPSIESSSQIIYQSVSNELRINGTGFIGAKSVDLYFSPDIAKEVDYEDVSSYPLKRNQVVLRLRGGYKWREVPGDLVVKGVDTGGGPVKQGDDGVVVASVQGDLDVHGVTVYATDSQYVYSTDRNLVIKGSGFNLIGNKLRFANGLLGDHVNYTISATETDSLVLRLESGSEWRANKDNLPGVLTLLAVNTGEGYVAVGPINSQKGKDVATVFERPLVFSASTKIYRTQSHELHIFGAGFTEKFTKPLIEFSPSLKMGTDYTLRVISRTEIEVTLNDGRSWGDVGDLTVLRMNTRGDADGWVEFGGASGVHVASIIDDVDSTVTGGVEVYQTGTKVYQSALQEKITITGQGFKSGISFVFEPALEVGKDYDLTVDNKAQVTLKLRNGKKWRADPGFIVAKSVQLNDKVYNLAGDDGIRVAVVLADPVVNAGKDNFHESQSKVIAIFGHGFTNVADTKVFLAPSIASSYVVLAVLEDTIRVQLKADHDWLPDFLQLKTDSTSPIPLQVSGIDTGAGEVQFENPITVGYIIKDREGVVCDDSCEYAFDGVCDDGTESEYYYYYAYYGYYMDDNLGGYYNGYYGYDYGYDYEYSYGKESYYGYYGYEQYYDDYPDDGFSVSACVRGTDCTDCGGVDAIIDYSKAPDPDSGIEVCTNTCPYARDGICDDPREANYCSLGTDCQDCGPVGADNFTRVDDDGWWDDDDDYWTFNDANFLNQNEGVDANRHRVKTFTKTDSAGPAAMFLVVLEGMVYTVGAIFAAAVLYLGMRWYNGHQLPFMNAFNPEDAKRDFEMAPTKRMPITPDVIRT